MSVLSKDASEVCVDAADASARSIGGLDEYATVQRDQFPRHWVCHDTCTVNDSSGPVMLQFNKECDDPYWDDIGLVRNQCYEGPSNLTEDYSMHCCDIDGQLRCSLCTMPNNWNEDWKTELERQLLDGAVFSFEGDYLCGDIPYEGECVTWDVDVTSKCESCLQYLPFKGIIRFALRKSFYRAMQQVLGTKFEKRHGDNP
ncbi:hypothetical protein NDN08_006433 [Rhodosorus marinus]|uniref:START domain-containing protein n=1 Tax=Rhodosorus marinus TaxID=101924 RepID=A0AAV8UNF5_9RHOD|nr:hypothetical protein NDN08_006433 [Rhodosorus marinus]